MKMLNSIVSNIIDKLNKKEEIAPFLFLGSPISKINNEVEMLSNELSEKLEINKNYIFRFKDEENKIKVKDIKEFLENVYIKPTFMAQIFIIENISRMTEESANSCLKIFEEPSV
jgi:DNA polymerase III gamma/tau subunit